MIVEKRKRLRKTTSDELDLLVELNFCVPGDWEDEPINEPSWLVLLAFVLLTGLSAYAIGSYFFGYC